MKKKLALEELTVKSFVTKLLPEGAMTIHGALDGDSTELQCLTTTSVVVIVPDRTPPTPYTDRTIPEGVCRR